MGQPGDLTVSGPALTLRYATGADAERFFALASDLEVTRFFSWSYSEPAQAREWIDGIAGRRDAGELLDFAVVHREHGVVGSTGLAELSRRDRRAMVGTWLGREHWGSEINAESKALICALAFGPLGMLRVGAYASTENSRSQRALERLGFVREGELREYHRHSGHAYDLAVYGLLRADWEASPLRSDDVEIAGEAPAAWIVG